MAKNNNPKNVSTKTPAEELAAAKLAQAAQAQAAPAASEGADDLLALDPIVSETGEAEAELEASAVVSEAPAIEDITQAPEASPIIETIEVPKAEPHKFIIIKSPRQGLTYFMPMGNPQSVKAGKSESFFTNFGYNEVLLSLWLQGRKQLKELGFVEYAKTLADDSIVPIAFEAFSVPEQHSIIKGCTDVKALDRWSTLQGLDASTMQALNEQKNKINHWRPSKK